MSNSTFMRLCVAGAALVLFATQPVLAQETPKHGGVLRHVVESDTNTFDCHATATSFSLQVLAPHYNTLLRIHPQDYREIIGDLAESWEISDDRLSYTFKLRDGVKFHDGSDFTSADIVATWERLRNPPEGVVSVRQGQFQLIDKIEAPDDRTVVFTLKEPNPAALVLFANPWNCVYSAAKLAEDPNWYATNVMGTGPFEFVEHVPGARWEARRFDGYWDGEKPYLDGIVAHFLGGPGVINALAGNQVDAALFSVNRADQERLKVQNPDLVFQTGPFNLTNFVTFNTTRPPFDDVRVRQAFNLAISRPEGVQILQRITQLQGYGALFHPRGSIADLPPEEVAKIPGMGQDAEAAREQARALLREAGAEGLSVTLLNRNLRQPWEPLGVFLLDQWRKIGVKVDQQQAETPQYFAALQNKSYELAIDFNNTVSNDPNEVLVKFMPGSPNNYSGIEDPKLTEMFQAQLVATGEERVKIVRAIEKHLVEQAYFAPLLEPVRGVGHHKDMKGWKVPPTSVLNLQLDTVWLDR